MSDFDYDLFVIGGGSGGVRAARLSSSKGLRVAMAEEYRMGGTCVIRGCVPKKLFAYAASYGETFEDAKGYGWQSDNVRFDWSTLHQSKDKEIERLEDLYKNNAEKAGVEIFQERAQLLDKNTIQLKSGRTLTAKTVLIATGSRPFVPDFKGAEFCLTSNEVFQFEKLPQSIIISGGGYIAVEFASILKDLGVEVTLVYRGDRILRHFDKDLGHLVEQDLIANGINIVYNAVIEEVKKNDTGYAAKLSDDRIINADQVLLALGRIPNTAGLGLEDAGIRLAQNGAVPVNQYLQTQVDNIYALGDVIDRVQLTPVAIHEAMCFVKTLIDSEPTAPDYRAIPTAVFSNPEIGTVGLTEEEAAKEFKNVEVYRAHFRPLRNTVSGSQAKYLMKIIVDAKSLIVVGAHVLGEAAGEMAQLLAISVKGRLTKDIFDATMALHPSASEELVTMYQPSYRYHNGEIVK